MKEKLLSGRPVIGTMISEIRTPSVIRILEAGGLDFVIIDAEHGCYSYESIAAMAAVAAGQKIKCLVRVPEISREAIMKPLDAGADGLVVPQVESADQVKEILGFAKYPPVGRRGVALRRGHSGYLSYPAAEYLQKANEKTSLIVQLESPQAVAKAEEIISIPGVDAAFVGPFDLSVAMGIPGELGNPDLAGAIRYVISVCKKYGVAPGLMQFQLDAAKKWLEEGIRFMVFSSDINMIADQSAANVQALRKIS